MKNLNYLFSLKTLVYFFLFVVKNEQHFVLQFIYSEKATKFCEILTILLSYAQTVKSKVRIGEDFAKFCGLLRIYELYIQFYNLDTYNRMSTMKPK